MPEQAEPEAQAGAELDPLAFVHLDTIAGDTRDYILDRMKHDHSALPWNLRGETEQQRIIDQTDEHARRLVEKLVHLVMTEGRPSILATLKHQKRKGEVIAGEVQFPITEELRHAFCDATGQQILIVLAPGDLPSRDRGKPRATPDQGGLFGEGDGGGNPPDDDDGGPIFDNTKAGGKQ